MKKKEKDRRKTDGWVILSFQINVRDFRAKKKRNVDKFFIRQTKLNLQINFIIRRHRYMEESIRRGYIRFILNALLHHMTVINILNSQLKHFNIYVKSLLSEMMVRIQHDIVADGLCIQLLHFYEFATVYRTRYRTLSLVLLDFLYKICSTPNKVMDFGIFLI